MNVTISMPSEIPSDVAQGMKEAANSLGYEFEAQDRKLTVRKGERTVCIEFHGREMTVWLDGETTCANYLPIGDTGTRFWTQHPGGKPFTTLKSIIRDMMIFV